MSRGLTCAIICFCVSRGRSNRYNLPSGLWVTADLPLERLLGPGASDLEALIAGGDDKVLWIWLGGARCVLLQRKASVGYVYVLILYIPYAGPGDCRCRRWYSRMKAPMPP